MLQAARLKQLHEIINTSTKAELQWINSYLDSILIADSDKIINKADKTITVKKITILYGTETGNAKSLALQFASIAKKNRKYTRLSYNS